MANPLDRVLAPDYLEGKASLSVQELRLRRHECHDVETGLSYFRRLIQGRLDIVHAEIARRAGGGEAGLEALIEQLPSILSEHSAGGAGRGPLPDVVAPENPAEYSAELDEVVDADALASLPSLDDNALQDLAARLDDLEHRVSSQRHALHERIDALQEEIVRRYKSGEASVDALLR